MSRGVFEFSPVFSEPVHRWVDQRLPGGSVAGHHGLSLSITAKLVQQQAPACLSPAMQDDGGALNVRFRQLKPSRHSDCQSGLVLAL
jgi:hypothetical protein